MIYKNCSSLWSSTHGNMNIVYKPISMTLSTNTVHYLSRNYTNSALPVKKLHTQSHACQETTYTVHYLSRNYTHTVYYLSRNYTHSALSVKKLHTQCTTCQETTHTVHYLSRNYTHSSLPVKKFMKIVHEKVQAQIQVMLYLT